MAHVLNPAAVDDTIGECARCKTGIWVAPRKLALWKAGFVMLICYACAVPLILAYSEEGQLDVVNLDADRTEVPRTRT
jgi:hypothetical protein